MSLRLTALVVMVLSLLCYSCQLPSAAFASAGRAAASSTLSGAGLMQATQAGHVRPGHRVIRRHVPHVRSMSRAAATAQRKTARKAKSRLAASRIPAHLAHVNRSAAAAAAQPGQTALADVEISTTLNCTVQTSVDSAPSFYGTDACATIFEVDGTLYGPDSIPAGPSLGGLTPASQDTVGSGTSGDPYVVTTVVDVGSTGITATEKDTWAVGDSSFSTSVKLDNGGPDSHAIHVYRAGDCYFNDSDAGFGEVAGLAGLPAGAVACRSAADQAVPGNRMMEWLPQTPGNTYIEDGYSNVWQAVGTGADLADTCLCTAYVDNGMALAWSATLASGGASSYASTLKFDDNAPGSAPGTTEQGVGPNETENSTTCYVKEPVNCATGDFFHQFTDFTLPGRGVQLSLQRSYSSAAAATDSPFGFGWSDSYAMSLSTDASGDATISQEDGSAVTFQPDGSGGFTPPRRVFATLSVAADGTYTFTRQRTQVQYVFSPSGQLTSEVDRNGYSTRLSYDGSGRLASVTDPAGRSLTFAYSGSSAHVSTVTDPLGRAFSYTYDADGNLVKVADPMGRTWAFTYDPGHLLLTMTDPRGGTVTNVYDGSNRVVSQTDAAGLKTTWAYAGDPTSPAGGTTTMTDSHGNQTVYSYVDLELMSVTHAAGTPEAAATSYTYDPATLGQATITDPQGNVTTNTYDANGNLISSTDPLGNTTFRTYNAQDDPTSSQTPSGDVTSYAYDGSGNLLTIADPLGSVTRYTYADASHPGDVTSVTDPDDRVTTYTYDAHGDRASATVSPAAGQQDTTAWTYDADGEAVCQASAAATAASVRCPAAGGARVVGTTTTSYDAGAEVTGVTDPNGHVTTFGYDADGNRTALTDPSGNKTTTSYDAENRPESVTVGVNGAAPSTTATAYDLAPGTGTCLASVTGATYCTTTTDPGGHVTTDYYDANDQLIEESRPGGQTTEYGYDLAGNQISKTDAEGRVTTFGYDQDNQLASVSYSDAATPGVTYAYDADGRRTSMTDGTGTTSYSYDASSRVTSVTNGAGSTVSYGYDGSGNVTTLTYPDGQAVTRTFDGAGRLSSVQDWLGNTTTFGYDPDGNLAATKYPDGDTVSSSYDSADQLTATQVAPAGAGTPLAAIAYTRNADGLVTQEADSGALSGATGYSYDAKNELTAASAASYGYDASGDPTSFGGTSQMFNAAGELTGATSSGGTTGYGYDPVGELTSATLPSGGATGYAYDQAGNLTSVQVPAPAVTAIAPAAGTSGTKVTISGSGFTSASAVKFGSAAAAFTVVSDSQITATAPAGAGAVNVTVSGPGGTSLAVSADKFTYTSAPAVTAISPASGPPAGGTSVTITGSSLAGTTAVHFGSLSAAFHQVSATSVTATAPAAATGPVDVTITTAAGTSAVTSADRYTYLATGPAVTSISPSAGPAGGTTKIVITGMNLTGATAVHFGAKAAATFKAVSATSVSATAPSGTGTVDVTVTTAKGTSAHSAADQFSYVSKPAVTKLSPATGPAAGGTTVTITGTSLTGATAVHFGTKAATFKALSATSVSATSPSGSGTIDVTVTTPGGTSAKGKPDHFIYTAKNAKNSPVGPGATGSQTTAGTYGYDGDGLRASKTTPAGTQQFTWDTSPRTPELLTDGSNLYIYGADGLPVEQIDSASSPAYFFHDAIGSTRALLGPGGSIGATFTYDAYGALSASSGTLRTPLTFTGAYRDSESGLYYLIHRYYDASTGRFLTVDPAVSWSMSPYGYAASDPLNEIDPLGLFSISYALGITTEVLGAIALGAGIVAAVAATAPVIAVATGVAIIAGGVAAGIGLGQSAAMCTTVGWGSQECGNSVLHANINTLFTAASAEIPAVGRRAVDVGVQIAGYVGGILVDQLAGRLLRSGPAC